MYREYDLYRLALLANYAGCFVEKETHWTSESNGLPISVHQTDTRQIRDLPVQEKLVSPCVHDFFNKAYAGVNFK